MTEIVKTAPARKIDRKRRQRIIDATLNLIAEQGVRALSHRRVAQAAGVPPSAPYYYFKTIDDLLEEAYAEAKARSEVGLEEIHEAVEAGEDLPTVLARFMSRRMHDRHLGGLSTELLVVVGKSERLQDLAMEWDLSWQRALARYVDDATASLLVALLTGLGERDRYSNPPIAVEELTATLRRAIDGPSLTN